MKMNVMRPAIAKRLCSPGVLDSHWPATSAAFNAEVAAWPTAEINGRPQTLVTLQREYKASIIKLSLELYTIPDQIMWNQRTVNKVREVLCWHGRHLAFTQFFSCEMGNFQGLDEFKNFLVTLMKLQYSIGTFNSIKDNTLQKKSRSVKIQPENNLLTLTLTRCRHIRWGLDTPIRQAAPKRSSSAPTSIRCCSQSFCPAIKQYLVDWYKTTKNLRTKHTSIRDRASDSTVEIFQEPRWHSITKALNSEKRWIKCINPAIHRWWMRHIILPSHLNSLKVSFTAERTSSKIKKHLIECRLQFFSNPLVV